MGVVLTCSVAPLAGRACGLNLGKPTTAVVSKPEPAATSEAGEGVASGLVSGLVSVLATFLGMGLSPTFQPCSHQSRRGRAGVVPYSSALASWSLPGRNYAFSLVSPLLMLLLSYVRCRSPRRASLPLVRGGL